MNQRFDKYKNRASFTVPKKYEGVLKYAQSQKDLLICLRGDCIHIYYNGGKILEIRAKSMSFDDKYLDLKKKVIPSELKWISYFKADDVIRDHVRFFSDAKKIMKLWFDEHPKQEREDQQKIAQLNKYCIQEGELAVVDIEYAVSFNSNCYNKAYKDTFKKGDEKYGRYPNPRFDIVAIDKNGQLYVLELKTGLDATKNCDTHITDFVAMIGSHSNGDNTSLNEARWRTFASEMDAMIGLLNARGYRNALKKLPRVNLNLPPVFMFVFTDKKENDKRNNKPSIEQRKKFKEIVDNAIRNAIEISEKRSIEKEVQNLIGEKCIREDVMYLDTNYKLKI